jgi:hypothetical protein
MTASSFEATAPELGLQLAASAGLVVAMIVIHSVALIEFSRRLHLRQEELRDRRFDYTAVALMAVLGLLLFLLHLIEILIFAGFYMAVGAIRYFEAAFYYSASVYATLGTTGDVFAEEWRLVGAIEAVIGFILIGWSTAFMVSTVNRLRG